MSWRCLEAIFFICCSEDVRFLVDIRQGIYDCKGCAIIWRSWRSRAFMNTGVDVDGAHVGLIFLVLPCHFFATESD